MAANPSVFRLHYDRPAAKFNYRTSLTVGTQGGPRHPRPHGRRRRRRGDRLGHRDLARRPDEQLEHASIRTATSASASSSTSSTARRRRTTTTATARTSPASSPATASIRTAQKAGVAPDASLVSLKVLDGNGNGTISNIIAALDWVLANHTDLQHPRRQHVGGRGDSRIGLDRPADARGQARRGRGHRRRRRGRQLRQERGRPDAVWRHQRAGQRAVGADGRRLEHATARRIAPTTRSAASARAVRRTSTGTRSRTWSRRAPARCRWRRAGSTFYLQSGAPRCCRDRSRPRRCRI